MADRPATLTQPLTRAQITEMIGGNPRLVRWFEGVVRDVTEVLANAAYANSTAAEAAQVTADAARIVADEAVALADDAANVADTALAIAQAGLTEIAALGGGGSVVAGVVTVTVPHNSRFYSESVALAGCLPAMRLVCSIAPHEDGDENSEELLIVDAMAARAGSGSATVSIAFGEPTSGPVKINLMAA